MNVHQKTAIDHHCRLAFETAHPRFGYVLDGGKFSVVLTVNSGYEWLEQGYGGPVWHCSVSGYTLRTNVLRGKAMVQLAGVCSMLAGMEWSEWTGYAYHIRRRLTSEEQKIVGDVVDCRGTDEAVNRFEAVRDVLPAAAMRMARLELSERKAVRRWSTGAFAVRAVPIAAVFAADAWAVYPRGCGTTLWLAASALPRRAKRSVDGQVVTVMWRDSTGGNDG